LLDWLTLSDISLSGNRAMTSLDLSSNEIGVEGATHVADAIKVSKCVVAAQLTH
jgi:hypothetical protein